MKRFHESEKKVEQAVVAEINSRGGIAYKFTSPARRSVPDRLIVLSDGITFFVECKSTIGKLTKSQEREIAKLRDRDHVVGVISSTAAVETEIQELINLCYVRRRACS